MSTYIYEDGAIHNDHHKEMTINISGKTDVVALMKSFMADDAEDVQIGPQSDESLFNEKKKSNSVSEVSFYDIVQYENPTLLVERLHQLIDGRKGADVGCVLLKCLLDGYLIRRPKQKEFESEFSLIGGWSAIHNYMDDNNENALDRANKIVIF